MSKTNIDLAISASWIIPVIPEGQIFEDCSLIINDGRIQGIVPQQNIDEQYQVKQHIRLPGQALIPGLINCHGHAAMSLLRGYADDKPLKVWLEQHIWPAEAEFADADFVRDGSELAIAEMLLSGTTCFSDMYFFPEETAALAHRYGIKAQISFPILDFPTAWAADADEYLHKGLQLHDAYRSHNRIRIAFGPHAPYTVSDEPLKKIATYAEELQAPIQIHLHETAFEVDTALKETGQRPIERLHALGLLSPLTQCVHMTQITDNDLQLLAETGAHVIHCPDSNMKLGSGICPTATLHQHGINVALGTDGAASNNDLSLLAEMQQAALLAKADSRQADVINAHQALAMATIAGARALGIDGDTGSLEVGKAADICAIDLNHLRHQPVHNAASQVVYTASSDSVSHVWVNGVALVKDAELTDMSANKLIEKAQMWKKRLSK